MKPLANRSAQGSEATGQSVGQWEPSTLPLEDTSPDHDRTGPPPVLMCISDQAEETWPWPLRCMVVAPQRHGGMAVTPQRHGHGPSAAWPLRDVAMAPQRRRA
ncbi:hypothetical protein CRUP_021689 [Coryphaenoides rupestris]|nr:hypothetical protein CRUP_021689 [Coryphaenoides rupestris]